MGQAVFKMRKRGGDKMKKSGMKKGMKKDSSTKKSGHNY